MEYTLNHRFTCLYIKLVKTARFNKYQQAEPEYHRYYSKWSDEVTFKTFKLT